MKSGSQNLNHYLFSSISNEQILNEVQNDQLMVPLHHLMCRSFLFPQGISLFKTRKIFVQAIKTASRELFESNHFMNFFIFLDTFKQYYQINDTDWQLMSSLLIREPCHRNNRSIPSTLFELCYMTCKLNQIQNHEMAQDSILKNRL